MSGWLQLALHNVKNKYVFLISKLIGTINFVTSQWANIFFIIVGTDNMKEGHSFTEYIKTFIIVHYFVNFVFKNKYNKHFL